MKSCQNILSIALVVAVAAALCSGCASVSYQQGRPEVYKLDDIRRVAVLPFADRDFTDLLIGALVNSSDWEVYDRIDLAHVMQEQELQQTPAFDKERAVELGRLAGVQMVVFGEYDYPKVRIEAVAVETGKYLVYRNLDVAAWGPRDLRGQTAYALQALLPYWIEYESGTPTRARFGPLADCLRDPSLMDALDEAVAAVRARDDGTAVAIFSDLLLEEPANPQLLNLLAWVLATSPDDDMRDGERAVELAREALDKAVGSTAEFTDTLAAALAATGEFEQAAEMQKKAIEHLGPKTGGSAQEMQRRLELYQSGKPMRR